MSRRAAVTGWLRVSALPWYLLTAGVTALFTFFALDLDRAKIGVPWLYSGDALATADHFKTTLEQGWYEHNPNLGAPHGQNYNDFPVADNLHMIAAKVLGLFSGHWPVVLNLYYFLGFILAALAAYWFFRVCRMWQPIAVALSVLYALAPYHFIRGESHLFLASYYCVPLGLGLLVFLLRGERLWMSRPSRYRWLGVLTGRGAFAVVSVALLATSSTYYGVFFIILLVFTAVFVLVRDRDGRRFAGAAAIGLVTVVVMLINMAPDVIFGWVNGPNPGGFFRNPDDSEVYALKLAQLLLPWAGNRITALSDLRAFYDRTFPLPSEQPALGLVGALGLVIALLVVAYMVISRRRPAPEPGTPAAVAAGHVETIRYVSLLTLVAFLFSTIGGLSTLISFFTTALRGWNRMSIVIAALCLVAFGLALQLLLSWAFRRLKFPRVVAFVAVGVVSIGVLGVGYYDQTPAVAADYPGITASYNADEAFFSALQQELPAGSDVFQLPYIPFPENLASNGLVTSDEIIPFLHTTTLNWSAGGIKGRPQSDWPYAVSEQPGPQLVKLAAASGMSGILVDTWAFDDKGAALSAELSTTLGEQPTVSSDGHWQFFDLRPERTALLAEYTPEQLAEVEALVTDPVDLSLLPDFRPTSNSDLTAGEADTASPQFSLLNDRAESRQVTVSFTVTLPTAPGATATVSFPDGQTEMIVAGPDGAAQVSHSLSVAPGDQPVEVTVDAGTPASPPVVRISDLTIEQQAVEALLAG